ncbi:MAG: tetratricopeptide repeat protein [Planctomycetota bacterium]|jgi:tetratricopeptide (TPR) repeat protein
MGNQNPEDSVPTPPKGPGKEDSPDQHQATHAPEGKTVLSHTPFDSDSGEKSEKTESPDDRETMLARSGTPGSLSRLRTDKGIQGDVSLPDEGSPGEIISGPASEDRYSVLTEIARGGMGAILKIVDNDVRRPVAMKVILGDEDRDKVERFVEEAQITGQLEHPNIVPVHELGVNRDGRAYFTMKMVRGESLESIIDKIAGRDMEFVEEYPLSHLLHIYLKICEAMAFAHSKGVIHRDLKPENIMVGRFGEVLVMDWGLAKVMGREDSAKEELVESIRSEKEVGRTLDGDVMGTPSYMPPEQADGEVEKIDEQSDIFSLGGILYSILTQKPPYTGSSVANVLFKATEGKVVPPRKRTPWNRISPELESICMKMMSAKRSDRYGTVDRAIEDIRAFLDNREVSSHRYGPVHRFTKFIQRHPTLSLSAGISAVLVTLGLALGITLYQSAQVANARAEAEKLRADREETDRRVAERQRDAAQMEVEGQQKSQAILESMKFLKKDEGYYDSGLAILDKAVESSKKYWKPYLVLAKHHADFGHHEKAEDMFEKANAVYGEQFGEDSVEILFEAGMYYGLPDELGGRGREETSRQFFKKAHEAGPEKVFGRLAKVLQLVIESKLGLERAGESLARAAELSDQLIQDKIARSVDGTWLARAWVYGISIFNEYDLPSFRKIADYAIARDALTRVVDESGSNLNAVNFLAMIHLELGDSRETVRLLTRSLKTSKNPSIYNGRAIAYMDLGEYERSISDLTEAIRMTPDFSGAYTNRGMTYKMMGDLSRALADLNKAVRLDPKDAVAFYNRGLLFRDRGDWGKAIADFTTALTLKPHYDVARRARGNAYFDSGELDTAIAEYTELIRRWPDNDLAYNARGYAYLRLGELEKALADFGKAIQLNPDDADHHLGRGGVFKKLGEADKCLEEYETAIRLDPKSAKAHHWRGQLFAAVGKFDAAIADFTTVIELDPKHIRAYCDRGAVYCDQRGLIDRAISDFKEVIGLDPDNFYAHHNLGVAYRKKRELQKAIGSFSRAIHIDPESVTCYVLRAFTYSETGDLEKAIADYSEAIRRDPKNLVAVLNRGNAYANRGEFEKAITDYDLALQLNPRFWQGHFARAHALYQKRRFREAISGYETALRYAPGSMESKIRQRIELARNKTQK